MLVDIRFSFARCGVALALLLMVVPSAGAQQNPTNAAAGGAGPQTGGVPQGSEAPAGTSRGNLLNVPVGTFVPGGVTFKLGIKLPVADSAAAQRGMKAFAAFNCVGCHMANGGGGMGPALSNRAFIYGSEPANIYVTIVQGRPRGMPAWGAVLPESIIWDLVAYVRNLSNAPTPQWGQTISLQAMKIEQVPAEMMATDTPWQHTQPFTSGQRP
jgi:cytochrome c oxidase cbb3-type subunit III